MLSTSRKIFLDYFWLNVLTSINLELFVLIELCWLHLVCNKFLVGKINQIHIWIFSTTKSCLDLAKTLLIHLPLIRHSFSTKSFLSCLSNTFAKVILLIFFLENLDSSHLQISSSEDQEDEALKKQPRSKTLRRNKSKHQEDQPLLFL